jgi:hypothetical protein
VRTFARLAGIYLLLVLTGIPGAHAQNVRTIFLVRHADKVSDDTDALLSEAGHRRAECLAKMLADAICNARNRQPHPWPNSCI